MPETFRYTDENPYISTGLSRVTEKGKAYTGFKADVAEFNDLFMRDFHYSDLSVNKMGLGIDEVVESTINFSRKNYADHFPDNPFPEDVKLVGNTIKSKKMPEYISKFLEVGIRLLLKNKGQEFLNEYYNYINKIYNYQIPLQQIASKGKVKKTIEEYKEDCKTITKSGTQKARQAWMELAIKENLNVNIGETIYYINTAKSKSNGDTKKVTHFYVSEGLFGDKVDKKSFYEKLWKADSIDGKIAPDNMKLSLKEYVKKHHPEVSIEDEIILCCSYVPQSIIDSEDDVFCEEGNEYNVPKYIAQFNKRITPLLVCFNPEIRNKILINNPEEKPYFTDEECQLSNGHPNKPTDQDTFEQLMTMDDKEIRFWMRHPEWEIPFIKECGMDWEKIKNNYIERMEQEKNLGIDKIRQEFFNIINSMTSEDFEDLSEGELPSGLNKIVTLNPTNFNFMSKEYPDIVIGTFYDIIEAQEASETDEDFGVEEF